MPPITKTPASPFSVTFWQKNGKKRKPKGKTFNGNVHSDGRVDINSPKDPGYYKGPKTFRPGGFQKGDNNPTKGMWHDGISGNAKGVKGWTSMKTKAKKKKRPSNPGGGPTQGRPNVGKGPRKLY